MVVITAVAHAQGLEQGLGDEVGIGFPADLLDHGGQHDIAGVGIGVLLARLEIERPVAEPRDQSLHRRGLHLQRLVVGKAGEVRHARGVVQQAPHRHPVPGGRRIRQPGLHRRVEIDQTALAQDHDGDSGELLADRGQAELGVARVRNVPFAVGQAIAPVQQDLAVARHQHRTRELILVGRGADDLIHPAHVLGQGRNGGQAQRRQPYGGDAPHENNRLRHWKSPKRDLHAFGGKRRRTAPADAPDRITFA